MTARDASCSGGRGADVFECASFHLREIASLIEILYLDPAKLPPPDKVIGPSASLL
jgi:hypothetical protein